MLSGLLFFLGFWPSWQSMRSSFIWATAHPSFNGLADLLFSRNSCQVAGIRLFDTPQSDEWPCFHLLSLWYTHFWKLSPFPSFLKLNVSTHSTALARPVRWRSAGEFTFKQHLQEFLMMWCWKATGSSPSLGFRCLGRKVSLVLRGRRKNTIFSMSCKRKITNSNVIFKILPA